MTTTVTGGPAMRTVRQELATAYPEHIGRIAELAQCEDLDDPAWDCAGGMLGALFHWGWTEEGRDFWADLARKGGWKG